MAKKLTVKQAGKALDSLPGKNIPRAERAQKSLYSNRKRVKQIRKLRAAAKNASGTKRGALRKKYLAAVGSNREAALEKITGKQYTVTSKTKPGPKEASFKPVKSKSGPENLAARKKKGTKKKGSGGTPFVSSG